MASQVRIKDIATKAGVSTGTVDRVLHNRGEVKEETRKKIIAIAKELNYKPNVAAQQLKAPTTYKIAVLLPRPITQCSFWSKHPIGITNAIEKVTPYKVESTFFLFDLNDEHDFIIKANELITSRPDGVILAPLHRKESGQFCHKLDTLKIPYLFIDTNIPNTNCISYIGEDAIKSGRIAASLVDVITPVTKDILIVNIAKSLVNTVHLNSRNQGFMSYYLENGRNEGLRISVDIPGHSELVVKEKLDAIFATNKNIGAILVSGSRTFAVAKYLKDHKINVHLVGYESIDENLEFLKNDVINFLICQRPIEQAEKSLNSLINHLVNVGVPSKIDFQPIDIINRERI